MKSSCIVARRAALWVAISGGGMKWLKKSRGLSIMGVVVAQVARNQSVMNWQPGRGLGG